VTVVAPSCALADALTKVMFMGDIENAVALARRWAVDVLAVDKSGRWEASPGLRLDPRSA
jgi:thiamine biosynthesis lipoprotein